MLDNNTYNLLAQMVQENKSLWRIRDSYRKDAKGCPECEKFWDEMVKDKEDHVRRLEELVRKHIR